MNKPIEVKIEGSFYWLVFAIFIFMIAAEKQAPYHTEMQACAEVAENDRELRACVARMKSLRPDEGCW